MSPKEKKKHKDDDSGTMTTTVKVKRKSRHDSHEKGKIRVTKIRDSEAGGLPSVKNEEYFHGHIPRSQTFELLDNIGDFLVRQAAKSEAKNSSKEQYMISVRVKDHLISTCTAPSEENAGGPIAKTSAEIAKEQREMEEEVLHRMIKFSRRTHLYYIHKFGFRRASGLIEYHRRHQHPIDENSTLIVNPVKRAVWQLNQEQIVRGRKLGDGAFGDVFIGALETVGKSINVVAVKTVNGLITATDNEKLFQEAMLMKRLQHPNIIQLVGVSSNEDPLMVVMEYAAGGSVLDAVKRNPPPDLQHRVYYCLGASKGLAYLENNHIIHRDIAARNVLVGSDGEAKISDFGLSLMGTFKKEKSLKKVPIRYLSPETLSQALYTHKSDVWSYGVFVWEVFHDGAEPYDSIENNADVRVYVRKGGRLSNQSSVFPLFLWALVSERCWLTVPEERPSFKQICDEIEGQMEEFKHFKPKKFPLPF